MSSVTAPTETSPAHQTRDAKAVSIGLFALTAMLLVMMALAGVIIPPVIVFGVIFIGVGIGLLRSEARWLRWAATVLPAILILANLPFALSDLGHPDSPAGFIPTLLVMALAVSSVVLGAALLRGREVNGRMPWTAVAIVAVAGAAFSISQAAGVDSDSLLAGDVTITADGFAYPERVDVSSGDASIFLENADPIHHSFVIEGQDVRIDVPGSSAKRVAINLSAGEYRFFCDIAGHETMTGTLTVG